MGAMSAKITAAVGLAGLLGACASFSPDDVYLDRFPAAALAPRHCYRTLGVVDCHARALPGEENREIVFFDAPVPR